MMAANQGKWFDKMMVIVLENKDYLAVLNDPSYQEVANKFVLLNNYHGVTNPSQPNYWSMIAADFNFGMTTTANTTDQVSLNGDIGDDDLDVWETPTIVDLLEAAGLTHAVYSENYPTSGSCFLGSGHGYSNVTDQEDRLYRRKHNPFIAFKSYTQSKTRCASQKDFNDLYNDLAVASLPDFSFIVPNQLNDAHDTTIGYTSDWFKQFVSDILDSPAFNAERVLVHVNYDEDDYGYTYYYNGESFDNGTANPYYLPNCTSYTNGCAPANCTNLWDCKLDTTNNQVYSVLFGSAIPSSKEGTVDDTYYTHASIPATMEANWNLGSLMKKDK